jgi:hypothetical protein
MQLSGGLYVVENAGNSLFCQMLAPYSIPPEFSHFYRNFTGFYTRSATIFATTQRIKAIPSPKWVMGQSG